MNFERDVVYVYARKLTLLVVREKVHAQPHTGPSHKGSLRVIRPTPTNVIRPRRPFTENAITEMNGRLPRMYNIDV